MALHIYRQLRDLVVCPHENGVVTYVQDQHIVEHDLACVDSVRTFITYHH